MNLRSLLGRSASTLLMLSLAACGGGGGDSSPASFTIGGTVTGLAAGTQIVLNDNGNDALTVSANGAFTFTKTVGANGSYAVALGAPVPAGQTCTVSNGAGTGATANVVTVRVTCSPITNTIGGQVAGLASGQQVTLLNNGANPVTVAADGTYTFAMPVAYNSGYAVTVGTQPPGETCTVANGAGTGVTANVANVNVTCSIKTFAIGGNVSGLTAGQQVTLVNGSDVAGAATVTADGGYSFANPVAYNSGFAVVVGTQPAGQTCTVANGSGSGVTASVANVNVTCSVNTFAVGGTVTGLSAGQQVTLVNGGDMVGALTATADGAYSFATPVAFNGSYAVTVGTQPLGQTCTVANGAGAGVTAAVSNVNVVCSVNTFTIGGSVTGLSAGQQVTLVNGADVAGSFIAAADGAYTFSNPVAFNGNYAVTVGTQPVGQTCSVSNGAGAGVTAKVANVNVTCSVNTFTIGGSVSGLTSGQQVTLVNGSDVAGASTVTADGAYAFTTPVTYNGNYAVTVGTQPVGQTCTVANGSGAGVTANVANVNVTCSVNTFTIGGVVSGLTSSQFTLVNGADVAGAVTVTANGAYTFATPVAYNGNYGAVTVGTQPIGQTCTVANPSGAGVTANVANVNVTCSVNSYTISGSVTGLTSGQVTLLNNGDVASAQTVTTNNGMFAFTVNSGGSYVVTVGTQPDGKTCSVSNGSGAGVSANVSNVGVVCAVNTFTISGTVTGLVAGTPAQQVTLLNNGEVPTAQTATTSNGSFSFTVPYGGSYAVTVGTQPTGETCRITGGTGTNVQASATVGVSCRLALAYVVNSTDHTISQYTIGLDGALTSLAAPIDTGGTDPSVVTVDPTGRFAYVMNFGSNTVGQYAIGATGVLTANAVSATVAAGASPYSIAIDPLGRYAFVTNQADNTVSQFTIGANGALTANGTASLPAGSNPYTIAVDSTGSHAYVANRGTGKVSQFNIDGTTGALAAMAVTDVAAGGNSLFITINPAGTYAYVTNFDPAKTVSQFSINATTGELTAVASVATGNGPYPVVISPNGQYAYWSNKFDNQVAQCVFAAAGALDCSAGVVGTGTQPQYIAIDPFGKHLFVANYSVGGLGSISQYDIAPADGTLTVNAVPTATTGSGPFSITTAR